MIAQKRVPVVTGAKKEETTHNSGSSIANQSVSSISWKIAPKPLNSSAAAPAMSSSAPSSSSSATTGAVGGVGGGIGRAHFQKNINGFIAPAANNKPAKFISHYASASSIPPPSSFLATTTSLNRTPSTAHQAMDGGAQSKRRNNNNSSNWGKNNASKKRFNQAYGTNTPAAPIPVQQQQQQPEQHGSPLQSATQSDVQQVDGGVGGKCRSGATRESPTPIQSTAGGRASSPIPAERESQHRRSPPVADEHKAPPTQKRQDSSGELEAAASECIKSTL